MQQAHGVEFETNATGPDERMQFNANALTV
jgi:hypothetical protein